VADWLVTGSSASAPLSSVEELRSTARFLHVPRRGFDALARVRVGAWSRPETLLRVLLEDTGLPAPVLNVPVPLPGGWRPMPDLAWPEYRVAVEYDGSDHRFSTDADAERHDRLVAAGWIVIHVVARELFHLPHIAVARVHHALAVRGYRPERRLDLMALPKYAV
jgi:hypothetical protein